MPRNRALTRAREGRANGSADTKLVSLLWPLKQAPSLPASSWALHLLIKDSNPPPLPCRPCSLYSQPGPTSIEGGPEAAALGDMGGGGGGGEGKPAGISPGQAPGSRLCGSLACPPLSQSCWPSCAGCPTGSRECQPSWLPPLPSDQKAQHVLGWGGTGAGWWQANLRAVTSQGASHVQGQWERLGAPQWA